MSGKFKGLGMVAIALAALGLLAPTALADVTGFFNTHISIRPQSTADELSLIDFDIENDLTVTVVISGLSTTFHTHFGIAGVEDVIVTSNATIGALDIETTMVFARFAFGAIDPFYDNLHFVKKMVETTLTLGGVTFTNLAQFEDVNAFISQTGQYAFGDVIRLEGATPSGVEITAETGICMERIPNSVKKHFRISFFSVNPDCAQEPKPDILFDFERILIEGVPVAPGIVADANILCFTINACDLTTTFSIEGGPVPIDVILNFDNLLSVSFAGAQIVLNAGAGTLTITLAPTGSIAFIELEIEATLNPETHPATLVFVAEIIPSVGLVSALIGVEIERAGLEFAATAVFAGSPAEFVGIVFNLGASGSLLDLEFSAVFVPEGLLLGEIDLTINF